MDKVVGNIIFNTLSSKQGIYLPGFGSLWVEYVSACLSDKNIICPPSNRVNFIPEMKDGAVSLIQKIEELGVDRDTAENKYKEWLDSAKTLQGISINGVGDVREGIFIPSEELYSTLNPRIVNQEAKPSAEKKLSNTEKSWIVLIILFALILAAGWGWWFKNNRDATVDKNTTTNITTQAQTALPTPLAETTKETPSLKEELPEITNKEAEQAPVKPTVTGTKYYVVGGVFSTQENADKFINDMKNKYPDLNYQKHDFKGGKIMVSLFGSDDNDETQKRRKELAKLIGEPELWIHKI